jgi:hypothetical protein
MNDLTPADLAIPTPYSGLDRLPIASNWRQDSRDQKRMVRVEAV